MILIFFEMIAQFKQRFFVCADYDFFVEMFIFFCFNVIFTILSENN